MAKAVYPGSFDPITLGHLDIIQRVSPYFEQLTVLVANSSEKSYLFSAEERKALIEESLQGLKGVEVDLFDGLTVDYVKSTGAQVIVRGIRAVSDFEHELVMANMNKQLASDIETFVVFASPKYHFLASRLTKEIAKHRGKLKGLIPEAVIEALDQKMKK